jgi:CopG family nickel-responsive transcriptional regulator
MQRVTLTIDDDLLAAIDAHGARHGYASRSEAVRDMLRASLGGTAAPAAEAATSHCHATLSYLYDHEKRELARRLTQVQHGHHDLAVASLHVHLHHDTCLEVAVLRGPIAEVKALADSVTTQRGVRYGHLHILPEGDAKSLPEGDGKPAKYRHAHDHGHEHPRLHKSRSQSRKAD